MLTSRSAVEDPPGGPFGWVRRRVRASRPESISPDGESQAPPMPHAVCKPLDWLTIQQRLAPVRRYWDLAVLCNLDEGEGRHSWDLLADINSQAGERSLSPQVLSGRLRWLEEERYVRHSDAAVMPLRRLWFLRERGRQLVETLRLVEGAQGLDRSAVDDLAGPGGCDAGPALR